jgi:Citrate transporter/ABC transporter substrate binding protein
MVLPHNHPQQGSAWFLAHRWRGGGHCGAALLVVRKGALAWPDAKSWLADAATLRGSLWDPRSRWLSDASAVNPGAPGVGKGRIWRIVQNDKALRLSGFFGVATAWVMAHVRRPLILLGAVVATSGVFSAFLVNDAICLVLTPLVLELTVALRRRPVPYLLAVAMASNVGSTATITGNPQNIMIGSFSHIPYTKFAVVLGPVALIGLIVTVALIALFHRAEFAYFVWRHYFVSDGGLLSYGPDEMDLFQRTAGYVDRILKGTSPSDLPVQQPTKFELVINLRTAKEMEIEIPASLLARADEVIE